jgi:hypothetical protein
LDLEPGVSLGICALTPTSASGTHALNTFVKQMKKQMEPIGLTSPARGRALEYPSRADRLIVSNDAAFGKPAEREQRNVSLLDRKGCNALRGSSRSLVRAS